MLTSHSAPARHSTSVLPPSVCASATLPSLMPSSLPRLILSLLLSLTILVAGVACERPSPSAAASTPNTTKKQLNVVATIAMIGDVAANIGGPRVNVTNLMGEGVDPHLYKASPGDVRILADADVILYSGLHLEGRLADLLTRLAAKQTVLQVTASIDEALLRQPPEFAGHFDPHVWFDVSLWSKTCASIRDVLIEKDPAGKDLYTANTLAYTSRLANLHAYATTTLATIPASSRVMVTAHDAFGYFGRAYNLTVLGVQGISTDSEASLQDINKLVDTLVSNKVPAVFIESSVPRKTIDALIEGSASRGHKLIIGGELYSDAMGAKGTPEGTYVGMVIHNVNIVTKSLGGTVPPTLPPPLQ